MNNLRITNNAVFRGRNEKSSSNIDKKQVLAVSISKPINSSADFIHKYFDGRRGLNIQMLLYSAIITPIFLLSCYSLKKECKKEIMKNKDELLKSLNDNLKKLAESLTEKVKK